MSTIDDLRLRLEQHAARLARRDRVAAMLQQLQLEQAALAEKVQQLGAILERETGDVARLERNSASAVIYSLLGKKEEKLDRERMEAHAAKLKYSAALSEQADGQRRIQQLALEKESLSGAERDYSNTFEALRQLLRQDGSHTEGLADLERGMAAAKSQLQEIDEALSAGGDCMAQIEQIESSLSSADSWGTWDLIGGGLLTDLAKHSHLDEAQAGAERLQTLLSRFRTELADVELSAGLGQLNVDGFLRFADYFFDGLIADWTVLSHIHSAQDSVTQVRDQVAEVLSRLEAIRSERERERHSLEQQLAALIGGR